MSSEGNDILEKRQMLSEKLQSILLCLFLLGSGGQRLQVTEGLNTMDLQWEIEVQPKNLFFLTQILRDCLLCQLKRKQKGHLELLFHIRRFWLCFWGSTSCTTYPFFWMHRRLMQTVSRLLKLQFNFTAKFIFTEIPQRCPIWVNTEGNRMKSPKVLSCFRDLTTGTLFTRISPLFFLARKPSPTFSYNGHMPSPTCHHQKTHRRRRQLKYTSDRRRRFIVH